MNLPFKDLIRNFIVKLPIKVTQNQWYDHCTNKIIKTVLNRKSNTIDVGCHKGEVLDTIIASAPDGYHYGFEPIPMLYNNLTKKYSEKKNITILPYALSDHDGTSSFNYVVTNPAYSGLRKRDYDHIGEKEEKITVELKQLDDCIPESTKITLIKIDVEGGEMGVLQGSNRILKTDKPTLIFEHGMGASEHYGTTPKDLYQFLEDLNYQIYLLPDYLKKRNHLTLSQFEKQFYQKLNYYFVASYKE